MKDYQYTHRGPQLEGRLFEPPVSEGKAYPLVVFLHGMGERGNDLSLVMNNGPDLLISEGWQKKHPAFLFAPLCPEDQTWMEEQMINLVIGAIGELCGRYPIDGNRIYLTGISMGGMGTWTLIARRPDLFAAAMPVCGAGLPTDMERIKHFPLWAFHAADDPAVPVRKPIPSMGNMYGTQSLVTRLRSLGSTQVHYTEYPQGFMEKKWKAHPHQSWRAAYQDTEALEWLYAQDRRQRFEVDLVMPGVYQIGDAWFGTHFYLVEGKDKALVIDTGMVEDSIGIARSLSPLPIELLVTHVHYDHLNNSHQFGKFYMSKKELPHWEFFKNLIPHNTSSIEDIVDVKEGDLIDLGGGIEIEVFELPGHSPGSLMLIDRYHNICFTGDTVGNGEYAWLQVPGSSDLSAFASNIDRFLTYLDKEGLSDITFLGGHRRQEWNFPGQNNYNPLCRELLEDMSALCTKIIAGQVPIYPSDISFAGSKTLRAEYGMAQVLFTEENRK